MSGTTAGNGWVIGNDTARVDDDSLDEVLPPILLPEADVADLGIDLRQVGLAPAVRRFIPFLFCHVFFPFLVSFLCPASHEYSRQAAVHGVHARAPVVRQAQHAGKTELLHEPELHDVGGSGVQHDGPTR